MINYYKRSQIRFSDEANQRNDGKLNGKTGRLVRSLMNIELVKWPILWNFSQISIRPIRDDRFSNNANDFLKAVIHACSNVAAQLGRFANETMPKCT